MPRKTAAAAPSREEGGMYRTANLNFAAYLRATGVLRFARVEPHEKFSEFYFFDPDGKGPSLWTQYLVEDLPVSARLLLETRNALLGEIRRHE